MKDHKTGKHRNIDISDLYKVVNYQPIKNFYIIHSENGGLFSEKGTSFNFNGFCFAVCTAGSCALKIGGKRCNLSRGGVMVLNPNQIAEVEDCSDDFRQRAVLASLDVILDFPSPLDIDLMYFPLRNPVVMTDGKATERLLGFYDFLEEQYGRVDSYYREEIAKTLLYALVLEVCELFKSISGDIGDYSRPRQEKLTDDFFRLLSKHYKTEHQVDFYARELNRTPKYLSGAIKRISGRSVSEWIDSSLISEIKLQLRTTDKTIWEISEELNFSSPSVFVQFFRRNTGTTPLRYRKEA